MLQWFESFFGNVQWSEIAGATVDTFSMLGGSLSLTIARERA